MQTIEGGGIHSSVIYQLGQGEASRMWGSNVMFLFLLVLVYTGWINDLKASKA